MPRQPVTLLHESGLEGADGRPDLLLAGTANKLALYSVDGSWKLLHYHDFCTDGDLLTPRFLVAQLAGVCLISHTKGGFWDFHPDSVPVLSGGRYSYLTPNDSLIALGITRANVVVQSRGFFFIANLEVNGVEESGLVHWSGFEATSFIPGGDSEAGYVSLGGDRIVAAEELGGGVVFYTNRSIWLASYVGGQVVWTFTRIYSGPEVPAFPRGVVNCGDFHLFVTANSIRVLYRGERSPRIVQWLDKASGCIFNGIRQDLLEGMPEGSVDHPAPIRGGCTHLSAWYDPRDQMVGISWADRNSELPNWTLFLSIAHQTACLQDHGITSATMTRQPLPGTEESLRAFLRRSMGCEIKPDINEHDPFPGDYPEAAVEPSHLYNETEDPEGEPSEDSYCSAVEASETPCLDDCPSCFGPLRLILASAEDFCLKEFRWDFDRREQMESIGDEQTWNNVPVADQPSTAEGPNPVRTSTYGFDPYLTLFQTDMMIGGGGKDVYLSGISIDLSATDQMDGAVELVPTMAMPWPVMGQGGAGDSARCASWTAVDVDPFSCGVDQDLPSYVRGASNPELHFNVEGRYVAYRIFLGGESNIGPVAFTGRTIRGRDVC